MAELEGKNKQLQSDLNLWKDRYLKVEKEKKDLEACKFYLLN